MNVQVPTGKIVDVGEELKGLRVERRRFIKESSLTWTTSRFASALAQKAGAWIRVKRLGQANELPKQNFERQDRDFCAVKGAELQFWLFCEFTESVCGITRL